jgi:uncharacterized protein
MKTVFADTSYYLALLNENDEFHARAAELTQSLAARLVTTAWALTEVADALSRPPARRLVTPFMRDLRADRAVTIVPAGSAQFDAGLEFFGRRPDKDWSLTDCISFVVMRQKRLREALTADHHFEQAGFAALML